MATSEEPPFLLDAARVVAFARLPPGARFALVAAGVSIDAHSVSRLAVVANLLDDAVFLLHCNETWQTVAAEPYPDAARAESGAKAAYAGIDLPWTAYRELTAAEKGEIETTRVFLRELAAGGLDE